MATATVRFLDSFESQIDDLLVRMTEAVQLDQTRFALAETSYHAVGDYLDGHALVGRFKPTIYPQGSMRLNTTVKPLRGEEFDLDFVCEFLYPTVAFPNPVKALDLIENALRESDRYRPMLERKNRCIRLNYQRAFHLDVLPACPDKQRGETCILVPDRQMHSWTASNPRGYAAWFERRAEQRSMTFDKAEPLPPQEPVNDKPILKVCVQLMKRHRDIVYKDNSDVAPISILITTLAAQCYAGEASVARAFENILAGIDDRIRTSQPRLIVLNPQNPAEDLSERWGTNPGLYREFTRFIREFRTNWATLLATYGIHRVAGQLEGMFGDELAKSVVEKQTKDIEAIRSRQGLGVMKKTGIVTAAASGSAVPIRPNTFHGEDT